MEHYRPVEARQIGVDLSFVAKRRITWPHRFEEGTMMRSIVRTSLIAVAASFLATVGAAQSRQCPA